MTTNIPRCSRFREDVATIFDVLVEVTAPSGNSLPAILTKFPEDYNDEAMLKSVREFSFPVKTDKYSAEAVQLFCFVLTDSQSTYTFGFCRYSPRNNTCLCILSGYQWPGFFYKVLNIVSVMTINNQDIEFNKLLNLIYHTDVPNPGEQLKFTYGPGNNYVNFIIPDSKVPLNLQEDKFMLEFVNALTPKQMIAVYASVLKERRIIFTGKKLGEISSCVCAIATLLHPMFWQGIFIPVLPEHLADMVMAPMPFLIGVPKQVMQKFSSEELGTIVVVDLDERTLQSSTDDTALLPSDVFSTVKNGLSKTSNLGNSIAKSFLRANSILFGGYRLGFVRNETTGNISWDREKWLQSQKPNLRQFLNAISGTDGVQYFERFVDVRMKEMNAGHAFSDGFDLDIDRNDTDLLTSLRGKVSGIQIASKLNKLATREQIRKVRRWPNQNESRKSYDVLSFDNMRHGLSEDSKARLSLNPGSLNSDKSTPFVPVAKLIDFGDEHEASSSAPGSRSHSKTRRDVQSEPLMFDSFHKSAQDLTIIGNGIDIMRPAPDGLSSGQVQHHPKVMRTTPAPSDWVKFE